MRLALRSTFNINRLRTDVFSDLKQPVISVAQPSGGTDPVPPEELSANPCEQAS
jgi:hypothetical protein